MSWKNKTCDTCEYRLDQWCRRFPESVMVEWFSTDPSVGRTVQPACGEYKEAK